VAVAAVAMIGYSTHNSSEGNGMTTCFLLLLSTVFRFVTSMATRELDLEPRAWNVQAMGV
jgi:hypothetical protein